MVRRGWCGERIEAGEVNLFLNLVSGSWGPPRLAFTEPSWTLPGRAKQEQTTEAKAEWQLWLRR